MDKLFVKILLASLFVFASSCNDKHDDNPMFTDNFDRTEMLEFWADDLIIPAYNAYNNTVKNFVEAKDNFYVDPSLDKLEYLRSAWLEAYLSWQSASMFEIGKAEELGLRNFTNIYPADVALIQSNINESNYNLALPSNFPAQGFPALDYLLFGQAENDAEILSALMIPNVKSYFSDLVNRLNSLSSTVLEDWNLGFREEFIENNGSSATASTDKMVNDFLFYYEKYLRAAKVGIPAGIFSGNEEPGLVEGKYSKIYSKQFFEQGFLAARNFFIGQSFDTDKQGVSLLQYLDEIYETNNSQFDIATAIITQWNNVDIALENVGPSFENQIIEDNTKMLAFYDELQKAIVLLKVDMLQALNIQVDFVDADGD